MHEFIYIYIYIYASVTRTLKVDYKFESSHPKPLSFISCTMKLNEMIGVLGHDTALLRLYWAGDNVGD